MSSDDHKLFSLLVKDKFVDYDERNTHYLNFSQDGNVIQPTGYYFCIYNAELRLKKVVKKTANKIPSPFKSLTHFSAYLTDNEIKLVNKNLDNDFQTLNLIVIYDLSEGKKKRINDFRAWFRIRRLYSLINIFVIYKLGDFFLYSDIAHIPCYHVDRITFFGIKEKWKNTHIEETISHKSFLRLVKVILDAPSHFERRDAKFVVYNRVVLSSILFDKNDLFPGITGDYEQVSSNANRVSQSDILPHQRVSITIEEEEDNEVERINLKRDLRADLLSQDMQLVQIHEQYSLPINISELKRNKISDLSSPHETFTFEPSMLKRSLTELSRHSDAWQIPIVISIHENINVYSKRPANDKVRPVTHFYVDWSHKSLQQAKNETATTHSMEKSIENILIQNGLKQTLTKGIFADEQNKNFYVHILLDQFNKNLSTPFVCILQGVKNMIVDNVFTHAYNTGELLIDFDEMSLPWFMNRSLISFFFNNFRMGLVLKTKTRSVSMKTLLSIFIKYLVLKFTDELLTNGNNDTDNNNDIIENVNEDDNDDGNALPQKENTEQRPEIKEDGVYISDDMNDNETETTTTTTTHLSDNKFEKQEPIDDNILETCDDDDVLPFNKAKDIIIVEDIKIQDQQIDLRNTAAKPIIEKRAIETTEKISVPLPAVLLPITKDFGGHQTRDNLPGMFEEATKEYDAFGLLETKLDKAQPREGLPDTDTLMLKLENKKIKKFENVANEEQPLNKFFESFKQLSVSGDQQIKSLSFGNNKNLEDVLGEKKIEHIGDVEKKITYIKANPTTLTIDDFNDSSSTDISSQFPNFNLGLSLKQTDGFNMNSIASNIPALFESLVVGTMTKSQSARISFMLYQKLEINKNNDYREIIKNILKNTFAVHVHTIIGDGNCFFRAVSLYLYNEETRVADIKKDCANFIEDNSLDIPIDLVTPNRDKHYYSSKFHTDNEWVNPFEIDCILCLYDIKCFCLHTPNFETDNTYSFSWTFLSWEPTLGTGKTFIKPTRKVSIPSKPMMIVNWMNKHFDLVEY